MNSLPFSSLSSNSRKQLQSNWSLALPRSRQLPWLRYRPPARPRRSVFLLLTSYFLIGSYRAALSVLDFAWMIFLPITNGAGDGHAARICRFVVSCQFFGRAAGY